MVRGFISGIVFGLIAIVLGLGGLSLLYGPNPPEGAQDNTAQVAPEPGVDGAPEEEQPAGDSAAGVQEDAAEAPSQAQQPPEPETLLAETQAPSPAAPAAPETTAPAVPEETEPVEPPASPAPAETPDAEEPAPEPQAPVSEPEAGTEMAPAAGGEPAEGADMPETEMTTETETAPQAPAAPAPAEPESSVTAPDPIPESTMPEADDTTVEPRSPFITDTAPVLTEAGEAPARPDAAAAPVVPVVENVPEQPVIPKTPDVASAAGDIQLAPPSEESPDMAGAEAAPEVAKAPEMTESGTETPPETGTAPDAVAEAGTEPPAPSADAAEEPEAPETETAEPDAAGTPETATAEAPAIKSEPIVPLTERSSFGSNSRLPTVGEAGGDSATTPAASPVNPDSPALVRNAQRIDIAADQPVMSVLLIDMGPERSALGDLKNLPFPVTFVVDASASDAADAVAYYRSAGAEVVLSVPMPNGARPSDVEVTLQAHQALLDRSVAIMMPESANFQTMGAAASQIGVIAAETGHGLISIPHGLNTGYKAALKEGAQAGLIFRELDSDGETGAMIRRVMDNAAFKAGQEQGVILLGHARVDTVQALIEWSLGNRAKSVALAPVSMVLDGG